MILIIVNIISSGLSLFLANYFFSSSQKKFKEKRHTLLLIIFILCHFVLRFTIGNSDYTFLELLLIVLIYILIGQRNEVPTNKILFWSVILLGISLGAEYIGFLLLSPFTSVEWLSNQGLFTTTSIIISSIIEIGGILLLKVFVYQKSNDGQQLDVLRLLAFLSIPLVSILVLYTVLLRAVTLSRFPFLVVTTCFIGLLVINFSVIFLYLNLSRQYENYIKTEFEKERLEQEIKFYEQVKQSQQEIRSIKHDLSNQLLVLLNKLENNAVSEATEVIEQLLFHMSHRNFHILSEHQALNFLLNEKYRQAEILGISIEVNSFIPQTLKIDDEILVAIFGNLLDNAIQACDRLKNNNAKKIKLEIKFFKNRLIIELSNPFDSKEQQTRKMRLIKGIGRKNIAKVVEKNGGLYEAWYDENNYFVSVILLNMTYE